jgi:hypothetical protein
MSLLGRYASTLAMPVVITMQRGGWCRFSLLDGPQEERPDRQGSSLHNGALDDKSSPPTEATAGILILDRPKRPPRK